MTITPFTPDRQATSGAGNPTTARAAVTDEILDYLADCDRRDAPAWLTDNCLQAGAMAQPLDGPALAEVVTVLFVEHGLTIGDAADLLDLADRAAREWHPDPNAPSLAILAATWRTMIHAYASEEDAFTQAEEADRLEREATAARHATAYPTPGAAVLLPENVAGLAYRLVSKWWRAESTTEDDRRGAWLANHVEHFSRRVARLTPATAEEAVVATLMAFTELGASPPEGCFGPALDAAEAVCRERLADTMTSVEPPRNGPVEEPATDEAEPPGTTVAPDQPREPPHLPFDLEGEPGLLGDLARWSLASSFRPIRSFAPLAAYATVAPLFGRRYGTPTGQGLNLYLIGLAETGAGKEALLNAPQRALDAADLGHLLGAGDFTSDSAIEAALRSRPNFLACIDEVGEFVGAFQHKNASPFSRTIRKTLLELYAKADPLSRWTGKQKADPEFDKASSPIYSPTLTILDCTTIVGFYAGLTEANLQDGLMNRLTVVRSSRPGTPNLDPRRMIVPPSIIEALKAADGAPGDLSGANAQIAGKRPELTPVPWAPGAEAAWMEVQDWQIVAEDAGRSGVTNRAAAQTLKLATLRALTRDAYSPAVTVEDIAIGWGLVRASIMEIERGIAQNMAGSEFETCLKAIEQAVVGAGPEGIKISDLKRKKGVSRYDDRMFDAAVKRLGDTDVIFRPGAGGKGRPPNRLIAKTDEDRHEAF